MHNLAADFARYEAEGTVFGSINKQNFESLHLLLPYDPLIAQFQNYAGPFDDRIEIQSRQSRTLAALRDALLPKLLSGEIRVGEAEEIVDDATAGSATPDITTPKPTPTRLCVSDDNATTPTRPNIEDFDTNDIMAAFRQALRGHGTMLRDALLKDVSDRLGFQRLGTHVREILKRHLRAAIRRGIVASDGTDEVFAATNTMADYGRDDLVGFIMSVTRKGTAYTREEVIQAVASHVGFLRVTDGIREPIKSAINAAIRRGVLAYEGDTVWREG